MDNQDAFSDMLVKMSQLKETLEILVKKRKMLGEYNTDAADILTIARIQLLIISALSCVIATIVESEERE